MKGEIDSLNASVAAGVLAYEIVRQASAKIRKGGNGIWQDMNKRRMNSSSECSAKEILQSPIILWKNIKKSGPQRGERHVSSRRRKR